MVLRQIPTISPSNLGVGDAIDRCIIDSSNTAERANLSLITSMILCVHNYTIYIVDHKIFIVKIFR